MTTRTSSTAAPGNVGTTGIDNAFLAAGAIAAIGSALALTVLPPARSFLPKLRLSPTTMPIH
jgi:hypothetical protein